MLASMNFVSVWSKGQARKKVRHQYTRVVHVSIYYSNEAIVLVPRLIGDATHSGSKSK